jgi:uncharacterized protein YutE (UPF0331/DUF86 family)
VVVRPEIVRERIAALRESVARLDELARLEPEHAAVGWAIERGLQVAAQALFDIGNHVLAGGFNARAADYASIPGLLRQHGVVSTDLESRLAGLAGFRNLLVHDYAKIDPDRVRAMLARTVDFLDFATAIETWLDNNAP